MNIETATDKNALSQLIHWSLAIDRLSKLEDIASAESWLAIERQSGAVLRPAMQKAVRELKLEASRLQEDLSRGQTDATTMHIQNLRRNYLRTETVLDFFADAINTRTSPRIANMLAAADLLAMQCMQNILIPLGHATPPVLTYIDKGLGASILKAGLRLWDRRSINPVAIIKVVRHNLLRPTALMHEAGHQVSHIVGWNKQLNAVLSQQLGGELGEVWGSWASEIAADAIAFVNTGYAAVAALRNVVDGGRALVFRFLPGDPHPIGYIRVLLGVEMCRRFYGQGPWNELRALWQKTYPLADAPPDIYQLLTHSDNRLTEIVDLVLRHPYPAFQERSLAQIVDPMRVSPTELVKFEHSAGPRLYTSPYVVNREALRLLALSGYRFATQPEIGIETMRKQQSSMLLLGQMRMAA
jgi:hypothetical protein